MALERGYTVKRRKRERIWNILKGVLAFTQARRVLVVPCAESGKKSIWFLPEIYALGAQVVGADLSPSMLHKEWGWLVSEVPLVVCDIRSLPFREGAFDLLINQRFICHFDEEFRRKALSEMRRVTSGFLFIHYESKHTFKYLSRRLRERLGLRKRPPRTFHGGDFDWKSTKHPLGHVKLGHKETKKELTDAGFQVVKVKPLFPLLSDRWFYLVKKV